MNRRILAAISTISISCYSLAAMADEPDPSADSTEPDSVLGESSALEWSETWDDFRWWEYPVTAGLAVGGLATRYIGPEPPQNWTQTNAFDASIYDAIAPRSAGTQQAWVIVSDIGFYGSMAYRVIEDTFVVGLGHGRWDIGWQMFWMDLEALSIISSTLWGGQLAIGRERPTVQHCDNPDRAGGYCADDDDDKFRSWYAGHPAVAMALAGTTCVHHTKLSVYTRAGSIVACGAAVSNALVTGVSRIVIGSHYMSDLLVGWTIGAAAGWGLPLALHYGFGNKEMPVAISPSVDENSAGLVARGRF